MKIAKERPPGRLQYDWEPIVEAAKASPGQWVKPEQLFPHTLYGALSRGKNRLLPPDQFEFRTGNNHYDIEGKRWCNLYFRYLGDTNERETI